MDRDIFITDGDPNRDVAYIGTYWLADAHKKYPNAGFSTWDLVLDTMKGGTPRKVHVYKILRPKAITFRVRPISNTSQRKGRENQQQP